MPWSLKGSRDLSRVAREHLNALRREKAFQREGQAGADTECAGGQAGMGPVSQQRVMEKVSPGPALAYGGTGTHIRLADPASTGQQAVGNRDESSSRA